MERRSLTRRKSSASQRWCSCRRSRPPAKIAKIRAHGAEAVISGGSYAEAQARCDAYVAESGALKIHPYDAAETIAGAGAAALEWEEDLARLALPALDTVLVAVGGGGLIAGIVAWFAGRVKVVGVEPEFSRAMAAFEAGRPVGGQLDRSGFARRKTGRRSQLRHRAPIRRGGHARAGRARASSAPETRRLSIARVGSAIDRFQILLRITVLV
jgi:Pyridoxal-phosphate dependent enzyme